MTTVAARSDQARGGMAGPLDPQRGHPRFAALDAIRGMAAVMTLLVHVAIITGANVRMTGGQILERFEVSVPIFFVLSGFLVYRPFVAGDRGLAPTPRLATYARRRALRILPAYWLVLLIGLTAVPLHSAVPSLRALHSPDWWRFFAFGQVYEARTAAEGLGQAWTLCVEAPFYVLAAGWALCWRRGRASSPRSLRAELTVLAALGVASWSMRVVTFLASGFAGSLYPFVNTIGGTFLWLAAGMMLAVWSVEREVRGRPAARPIVTWPIALALLLYLSFFAGLPRDSDTLPPLWGWTVSHGLYAVIAVLLVLPYTSTERRTDPVSRLLNSAPAGWLGRISYGFYLWHIIVIAVLMKWGAATLLPAAPFLTVTALATVASAALGTLSYYGIERPALRLA